MGMEANAIEDRVAMEFEGIAAEGLSVSWVGRYV